MKLPHSAAGAMGPVLTALLGDPLPVGVRFWDGSTIEGAGAGEATVVFTSPAALRRILWAPNELGFGRAYVTGEIEIEGDALSALRALANGPDDLVLGFRSLVTALAGARRLGVLGRPPVPPAEEARLRGRLHTRGRDAAAVSHHYDVGNDFYRLVLGPSMTYSCARFVHPEDSLETAQSAKYDLICRKLGLAPGMRLLDVGCGWGGMLIHAATHYGVTGVGVTVSAAQQELAAKRVADAGLAGTVDIRLQDYRDVVGGGETFDAVSSIGMFEHVGRARMAEYFSVLHEVVAPGGRLLNHAISTPDGAAFGPRSFVARYVFPDGELQDVATVAATMEQAGFEVRDVESLREHYALTLRRWVANLEDAWDRAVALVGPVRARVWRLYMLGAVASFESAEISVHQVLGVRTGPGGDSGMPPTRAGMI